MSTGRRGRGKGAKGAAGSGRRGAGSFRRGFINRNPLVLVGAVLLAGLALMGIEALFVSGAWTAVPMKYWMRKASDDYTYVSWIVGHAKKDPPGMPAIYLLGGSTARESITSGDSLAREIKQDGGPAAKAWDLGSMNQNFAQSLAVADNVPPKDAWLLIGLNLGRFTPDRGANLQQAVGREFFLKSDFLKKYVADKYGKYKYDPTILPGILAAATSYVQQHSSELLHGHIPAHEYGQHRYNQRFIHSRKAKEAMVRIWNRRRSKLFESNVGFNLAMLEQLLIRSKQRGLHPVLIELPNNRAVVGHAFDYAVKQYQQPSRALAAKYGVPYVDFNSELHLKNKDFHDLSHLVESGRVIWQRRLAQEMVKLMGGDGGTQR